MQAERTVVDEDDPAAFCQRHFQLLPRDVSSKAR